ncbi:MAG TPA: hypothetical protein VMZ53_03740 [Kofleriaceae bacterium]|nr:hypothetical protein [Kofleriaceae bacterium]
MQLVTPTAWIAARTGAVVPVRPPMIYVAHPVAAQAGEAIATCTECDASHLFAPGDPLDLRLVCQHDAPIRNSSDPAAIVAFNCARALRWWRWLHLGLPDVTWVMPWYVNVIANGEADPVLIERGLRDDCEVARRCDALMACGPRISSGMRREAIAAAEVGNELFQIVGVHREPPVSWGATSTPWQRWAT